MTSLSNSEPRSFDAVVVGGGFYGARIALLLRQRGLSVQLLERDAALMGRASLRNQARVHNGYHYPRSILTSLRSRVNYARFVEEYPECVADDFTHYYATAGAASKVTGAQFAEFCRRIEAPIVRAPDAVHALFDAERIDAVFEVRECAFNATKLRGRLERDLDAAGVECVFRARVKECHIADGRVAVGWTNGAPDPRTSDAQFVFNCTYSALNEILIESGSGPIPMKREFAELALVQVPPALAGIAVTVMDGPFFSLMPYPPYAGLHTLSHVRYTPHYAWADFTNEPVANGEEALSAWSSRFPHMLRDAARYLPAIAGSTYVDSLWETKAIMPRSEQDDSRPILFRPSEEIPGLVSVLGAKLDSVYDVEDSVRTLLDVPGSNGKTPAASVPRSV